MAIDVHAHAYPDAFVARVERGGGAVDGIRELRASDSASDVAARLDRMDAAGIALQVLSISAVGADLVRTADAVRAARIANDGFCELAARHPDRFAAFGVVPLPDLKSAIAEADRVLAISGIVGIGVTTAILGRSIGDPIFDPFLAALDEREAVLFIHPVGAGAESRLLTETGLTWPIGAPLEDTICATHLVARAIPVEYPRLRIVITHLGGALPVLLGRLEAQLPRLFPDVLESAAATARRLWYDTVTHADRNAIRAGIAALGPERLVFGTDDPYVRAEHLNAAVAAVKAEAAADPASSGIMEANARRLLRLPTPL